MIEAFIHYIFAPSPCSICSPRRSHLKKGFTCMFVKPVILFIRLIDGYLRKAIHTLNIASNI